MEWWIVTDVDAIVHAVQRYGSDADDLRDAVHEACHALEVDVPRGDWDRETIHDGIMACYRKRSSAITRSFQLAAIIRFEVTARAVERLICAKFDVDIGDPRHWANIACIEAARGVGIKLPSPDWFLEQVEKAEPTDRVQQTITRILALGTEDLTKPLQPVKKTRQRK
jgi:hypothetical protein